MSNHNERRSLDTGFTLIEVLIIAPIVVLMIGIFITTIVSMTGEVLSSRSSNNLIYNIQGALDKIEQDVRLSGAFLSSTNVAIASPQGSNDTTVAFKNANSSAAVGPILILNAYATTTSPLSSSKNIMYMANQPYACNNTQLNQNPPVTYNVVYFVKNETLWRRTIMPSNYATVGCKDGVTAETWQKPTCSPGYSSTFCKSEDEKLVEGIAQGGLSISYYTSQDASNPNPVAADSTKPDDVRQAALKTTATVSVTITATTKAAGRTVTQTGTIRATSTNNYTNATADSVWSSLLPAGSSWSDYGGSFQENGYRKTRDGIVVLKGLIKKSSAVSGGEVIGTLPVGYRPSEQLIFQTCTNPNTYSRIDIRTNGEIAVYVADAGWLSLDNIRFLSSDSPSPSTALTGLNGWVYWGSQFATPAYAIDADGRVHTKGLMKNGTITDGTPIVNLPAGARPSEYHFIADSSHNGSAYLFNYVGIDSSGNMLSKGLGVNGSTWISIQSIFYPSGYTGWLGLDFQNSWAAYGSPYTTPQYTKGQDGLVSLHGLIKSGTIGATASTLPVGYRPANRLLFVTTSNGGVARLDIDASGNIIAYSGSNAWYSLDGITFYAEQ